MIGLVIPFFVAYMNSNPVVTRRVVVKAHKIGHVRSLHSADAQIDAATATRIEETPETRAYVRPLGLSPPPPLPLPHVIETSLSAPPPPIEPSAPPQLRDQDPELPPKNEDGHGKLFGVIAIILVLIVSCWWLTQPRPVLLEGVSWTFSAEIQERQLIVDEGWMLPPDGDLVEVLSTVDRQQSSRQVIDHYDTVCKWIDVSHITYHTKERQKQVQSGWTEPLEVYSHTEEVCYADGRCEEKDVYEKVTQQPVYQTVTEVVEVPTTVWTKKEQCDRIPISRTEPVMGTYYKYRAFRWKTVRHIHLSSLDGDTVTDADPGRLGQGERYGMTTWAYYLHFPQERRKVSKEVYDAHLHKIGQLVVI